MNITVINQILTEEQKAIINKAIETLTPIYEKAINRPIQQSEIDRLHWAYSGCFIENRGGEEEFIFVKGRAQIEIYSFNTPFSSFAFEIIISDNGFTSERRENINKVLGVNETETKFLSPIETVAYYAEILESNIETIEKFIL